MDTLSALLDWRGRERAPSGRRALLLGTLLVAAAVCALCWPSRAADFEADDFGYIRLLHDQPVGHFLRLGDVYARLGVIESPVLYGRPVGDWWRARRGVLLELLAGEAHDELDVYLAQWNPQREELVLRPRAASWAPSWPARSSGRWSRPRR